MMDMIYAYVLAVVAIVSLEYSFTIEKGITKRLIYDSIVFMIVTITSFFHMFMFGCFLWMMVSFLYVLFYSDELIEEKRMYFVGSSIILGLSFVGSMLMMGYDMGMVVLLFTTGNQLLRWYVKQQRNWTMYGLESCMAAICCFLYFQYQSVWVLCLVLMYVATLEYHNQINQKDYEKNTKSFQSNVMMHHYEEVKTVYLNMRGWRHDYHNHLQTIKAYLQMQEYDQLQQYLLELEKDLTQVDTLVKSGNLMVDAILNSKLSLALDKKIALTHTSVVPEELSIADLDICVILGNLLDNAIESCMQLEEEKRFIRVYMGILKQQLYICITNAAVEEISFSQKNYVSEKRGDHGHGMKRVQLTVDKYGGYLNLQNEPGVFVSEVLLPLVYED